MDLKSKISELAEKYFDEVVAIRRHLHKHPELAFGEFETAKYIAAKLDEYGIPYRKGVAGTGIVAVVEGKNPSKKIIALRADMDALPIEEANTTEYESVCKGKMHACGHDVHTASLLGTIRILRELKNEWEGSVKFIFQPAEEKIPGGAKQMIEEGALQNPEPEIIIAQHVLPDLKSGSVGFRPGLYMASTDEIFLTVKGKGGHGAVPNEFIDPVLISSHIIVALQQIVSRHAKPTIPTVLSFGKVIAGGAVNIIPDEVKIDGTFRTMNESWREEAHRKITSIATSIAESMGGSCEVKILKGYPALINDEAVTHKAKILAEEYIGKENVTDLEMRMTAEDFSYFAQQKPALLYRLGSGNKAKNIISPLHSSTFDVDENCMKTGMGVMAWLAVSLKM